MNISEHTDNENKVNNYIYLAFWVYLAYFTYSIVSKKIETVQAFIHNIDLPIHEFGHQFFGLIFGDGLMMIAGGNLFQFIFPCIMTGSFFFRKDYFGGFVCSIWAGETLIDASYYIADATDRDLPLITGDPDTHDWFNILSELNIIQYDHTIGRIVFFIGSVIMITGLLLSFYHLNRSAKFIEIK